MMHQVPLHKHSVANWVIFQRNIKKGMRPTHQT
jgi:hypothetical protein